MLNFLRPLKADGVTDLGDAMKTFVAQNKRRGLAVLLSDLYDPAGFERGINVLRFNRFEPLVIHLADALAIQFPQDGPFRGADIGGVRAARREGAAHGIVATVHRAQAGRSAAPLETGIGR